jgi:hypothetical protein
VNYVKNVPIIQIVKNKNVYILYILLYLFFIVFLKMPTTIIDMNKSSYTKRSVIVPLFTDNSRVYYTPYSLAPGGVGTVRNMRVKANKT